MKLTKLAAFMALGASCAYIAPMVAYAEEVEEETLKKLTKFQYPETRTHQSKRDDFLQGEYGRPSNAIVSSTTRSGDTSDPVRPDDGIDHYFEETIVDKYRWLEEVDAIDAEYAKETTEDRKRNPVGTRLENEVPDDQFDNRTTKYLQTVQPKKSSEVNDWVNAQNAVTKAYLEQIPYYQQVYQNIDSLMNRHHSIRKVSVDGVGEIHYFRAEDGFGRIVYTDQAGVEHLLMHEKELMSDGNGRVQDGDIYVSEKGSYVAFFVASGSADSEIRYLLVLDVKTGKEVARITPINRSYVELEWIDDKSFLYVGDEGTGWASVYRHEVGAGKFNDPFEVSRRHLDSGSTINSFSLEGKDKRYIVVNAWRRGDVDYIKDRKTGKIYRLHDERQFKRDFAKADGFTPGKLASFVHLDEKTLDVYFISSENTLKGEIIKSNLKNLSKREVVVSASPEYEEMIEAVYHDEGEGYFLINYRKDATHRVVLTDKKGKIVKDLSPNITGNALDLDTYVPTEEDIKKAKEKGDDIPEGYVSFRYYDTITPRTIYKYSPIKGEMIDVRRRDLYPFATEEYESKHVMYTSKDGTKIPMTISYKKGTVLNGKNPTVLYGYGGFGLAADNYFRFDRATWLEHGGIWVNAHLRGGEEYGREWHEAGKRLNKLNVFDDFEAAADYLFANGYTSPDYLSISGASNGGLLVGAAMTLNPSKYRVAIPEVGVLDMLRHADNYHTQYWVDEYGTPYDSKEMYNILRSYSPYHNVKAGICYPSTIVMTSKRDDRVTPSHSYKFAAELQDKQSCDNPTFLYAAETHGHGPNTWQDRKENYQIVTAFRLHEMGITSVPTDIRRPSVEELKGEKWLEEDAKAEAKKQEAIKKYLEEQQNKEQK